MARGRVFQENILDKIPENRIYARYLTGVIQADFLDEDDEDDIATSDRQRIQEDDPRFRALVAFVKKSMQAIEKTWSEKRKQIQGEKAVANHPALDLWINSLGESHKAQARKMINTVASLHMTEDDEDSRKEIYKSAILAFERLKLRGGVEEFNEALQKGTDEFLKVISNFDDYEISLYRDLINNRLNGIQILEKMVDNGSWENHIRDFIFDRLWLIDPSWERAINSEIKETTIHKQFEKGLSSDLTSDEERGRVDIAYRNITQGHIIVELKKPSVKKDIMELVQQGRKYKTTLVKCLKAAGENHDDIKIVFILGEALDDILDRDFIQAQLLSINARVVTYGEIIIKARSSYSEFIEKSKEKDRIRAVVDSL